MKKFDVKFSSEAGRRNAPRFAVYVILDSSGAAVVKYCYDASGNHKVFDASGNEITSASHIGNVNPLGRYIGKCKKSR